MPVYSRSELENGPDNPNLWFARLFPEAAERFGPAFLEATYTDMDGLNHFVPAYLNEDFFACILGGDERIGPQTVYYPPEKSFYCFDSRDSAFFPVTEEKLKLLLSNYLIRCSQACNSLTDISNLVVKFRKDDVLDRIIKKAKAVLEAEDGFFEGQKRRIGGRIIETGELPTYVQFVKNVIVKDPNGRLTIGDAFHSYYQFCKAQKQRPLTRQEFKHLVAEVIREEFRIGLRHDVPNDEGKANHGWLGIDCRLPGNN